jgi:PAS domain S-box-containing protein
MLGYEPEDLMGTTFRDFTHPDDVAADRKFVAAAIAGELDSFERDKRYVCRDGSLARMHVRTEVIRDKTGEPLYFVSHLQDLSGRRAAQELLDDSERTLRSIIDNTPVLLYVKGRDYRYQLVNREFEQVFGVHNEWIVGRSDEDILPASAIDRVRARDRLVLDSGVTFQEEETMLRDGQERVFLTIRYPLLDESGEIQAVCAASTDVTERRREESSRRERRQCSEEIHSALAQNRFVLHGQPIMSLTSTEVEQAELLIRRLKVHGGEELEAPDEFLPEAERFDQIQLIDEWVVDCAIELAAAGHRVEVNLSAKTISDPGTVNRIERKVVASGAAPGNLIFEITETAAADNLEAARAFAVRLRKLGCAFALDDFGVGHGAFTYLRHLPVDYLKIDIQFVRDLVSNDTDRQVVQAIIGVARQFEIKTIAEGVENQATLEELRRIGVDYAQGNWIGWPVPLHQLWESAKAQGGDAHATWP